MGWTGTPREQVLYGEGLASHTGPESCVAVREDRCEALTGECVGQPLSGENIQNCATNHGYRSRSQEPFPGVSFERRGAPFVSGWLASVLTCTGWNKPTRIICAIPRASLRSLLLTCALRNAFACRVSMQIAGTPASANPLNSHCDRGPASRPTRSSRHAGSQRTARRSSG